MLSRQQKKIINEYWETYDYEKNITNGYHRRYGPFYE